MTEEPVIMNNIDIICDSYIHVHHETRFDEADLPCQLPKGHTGKCHYIVEWDYMWIQKSRSVKHMSIAEQCKNYIELRTDDKNIKV